MKAKYALLAMTALAREHGKGLTLAAELSTRERIPHKFLELILLELKNVGFLISKKGRGGGYALAKAPSEISVGEIVRCMEGPVAPMPCTVEGAKAPCDECHDLESCGLRMVMADAAMAIEKVLNRTTLADVLARQERAMAARARDASYQI